MQLLISVRNLAEARLARQHGIRRIDLKEPQAGSLGAASPRVWAEVLQDAPRGTDVSLALGELTDAPAFAAVPEGTSAVKVGLSRCRSLPDWPRRLAAVYAAVPAGVERVAVYYADTAAADSPDFTSVLAAATALNCQIMLIDTFDKSLGPIVDACPLDQAQQWQQAIRAAGLQMALGGSLRREHLAWVEQVGPDIVAVRGGVCGEDRRGSLCPERLQDWTAAWNRLTGAIPIEPGSPVST